ncbi:uncharacterized protein LOC131162184 [Malania oleifera]|uniref:uncharacterized protein LOC131162184 n=1 Tax=Malania oleifera TaxID=397392 RepID=UPI0025AE00EE|nr:uncharacterized protein LOC131162184 [Malania oleifera]
MLISIAHPKAMTHFTRWVSDLDWRLLLLIAPLLSLLVFFSLSASSPFASFPPIASIFYNRANSSSSSAAPATAVPILSPAQRARTKAELNASRIAVCLVGGARRFELTGPSIVERILREYPRSDLFLHSPVDRDAYKFSLLKDAPRVASVRLFEPAPVPETESQLRVLTAHNSPNGIQGLLQYFNLVEGCLTLVKVYQEQNNLTYDWIVRTRVDGYWSGPLDPGNFIPGHYLVPPGSTYGGLNDRLGIGDFKTSVVALSRLSVIPHLDSAGFRHLNSETAFKAQLTTQGVPYVAKRLPFCVVSDRKYGFPPGRFGVPVAALSSPGPLSGAKCRPCTEACVGQCVAGVMSGLERGWSWTDWANGSLRLCDAHAEWERGWERIFDRVAGKKLAQGRKRVRSLELKRCVNDLEEMRRRSAHWEAPPAREICKMGLASA